MVDTGQCSFSSCLNLFENQKQTVTETQPHQGPVLPPPMQWNVWCVFMEEADGSCRKVPQDSRKELGSRERPRPRPY